MPRLVLVRHGETRLNREGRYQGHVDPDLTRFGEDQARAVGRALDAAGVRPDAAYTSDLLRARRTAALALPDVAARPDARLRELAFGEWEGRSAQELDRLGGPLFGRWLSDPERVRPPGGESLEELRGRLDSWLRELPHAGTFVVVTHGGPARILRARMLGLPARWDAERPLHLPPGALAVGELWTTGDGRLRPPAGQERV